MTDKNNELPPNIEEEEWKIRPCILYKEEYDDCMSMKARFHQYFIFGELQDCSKWKQDCENCRLWKGYADINARAEILKNENERRKLRLDAHYNNTVWKKRSEPPVDWNKPLPEWMVKRDENSYLALKSRQLQGENVLLEEAKSFCSIM